MSPFTKTWSESERFDSGTQVYTEGEILNFTEAPPVEKKGKVVNYGPYENIDAAFVNFWIKFHYVNNAAFAAATQLDRELEVSHWGNIYVEERYIVVSSCEY